VPNSDNPFKLVLKGLFYACLKNIFRQAETFAKYPDVDEVRGVAAQRVQTYQIDRQTSEQRTTKKFAADGYFAKVSVGKHRACAYNKRIFFHTLFFAMRILLAEDDQAIAQAVCSLLGAQGYAADHVADGEAALNALSLQSYDILLLDLGLPGCDGLAVLQSLRRRQQDLPVLIITARDTVNDRIEGLDAGADDYIVKPARRMELLTRIEAVLRRSRPPADQPLIDAAPYQFDLNSHTARLNGEVIDLTEREFELAVFLFRNVGRLVSRGHLLESLWGRKGDVPTRTVDTHMSRVRSKLALRPENGYRLASTYNYGYRLERVADDGKRAEEQPAA